MAKKDEHLVQAAHNAKFRATIDRSKYGDWWATATFYEALHYVDSHLAHFYGAHPTRHVDRDAHIKGDARLKTIWSDYRILKDDSIAARYECVPVSSFAGASTAPLDRVKAVATKWKP